MRLHWYWPFARREELAMAHATAREGDELVVEVIDRDAAPEASAAGGVLVVRDLPEVNRAVGRVGWAPSRAATYLARARARRRHWRSDRFDLIHLLYTNRFTDALAPLPSPVVMTVHDVVPHVTRAGAATELRLLRHLYRRPQAIVVHHEAVGVELHSRFDVEPQKIHVVPYPVLTAGADDGEVPAPPVTILLFGALRPNKGLEVMARAMNLLSDHDMRLVIAGRGHRDLERRAVELADADDRITAEVGFVSLERKQALFRRATVVALPYTSFSSHSAVLQDAYGYGRPVVATSVGALGPAVQADGTGIIVEPGRPDELASALVALSDHATWRVMAAQCRVIARERTPERFGAQLRAVYEGLLG